MPDYTALMPAAGSSVADAAIAGLLRHAEDFAGEAVLR